MRYDRQFGRGYDRGMQGGARYDAEMRGGAARYDAVFRAGGGPRTVWAGQGYGRDYGARGGYGRDYGGAPRGYDQGYGGGRWDTPFGRPRHSRNQDVAPGETDFLGRPYPRQAQEDRPWGLIDQTAAQHRAGMRRYGVDYRGAPRYDAQYRGGGGGGGYDRGFRGYDAGYRGDRPIYNLPDSDEAGVDVHRFGHGRDMRYTSNWTRWF